MATNQIVSKEILSGSVSHNRIKGEKEKNDVTEKDFS